MIGSVYVTNFKKILGIAFCSMFTERTGSYIVSLYVSFFFVLQNWSMAQITTDNSPKSNAIVPHRVNTHVMTRPFPVEAFRLHS